MAPIYIPPATPEPIWDPFSISVDVTIQTYGSGDGVLVVDPFYTYTYPQEFVEAFIDGDVNDASVPQLICFRPSAVVGSPGCSGEAMIPITLGSAVDLVVAETNEPSTPLPAGSTLSADFNVWTVSGAGEISAVSVATAVPEPASWAIVGIGLLGGVMQWLCQTRKRPEALVTSHLA
jgi:hypothetical protein